METHAARKENRASPEEGTKDHTEIAPDPFFAAWEWAVNEYKGLNTKPPKNPVMSEEKATCWESIREPTENEWIQKSCWKCGQLGHQHRQCSRPMKTFCFHCGRMAAQPKLCCCWPSFFKRDEEKFTTSLTDKQTEWTRSLNCHFNG